MNVYIFLKNLKQAFLPPGKGSFNKEWAYFILYNSLPSKLLFNFVIAFIKEIRTEQHNKYLTHKWNILVNMN